MTTVMKAIAPGVALGGAALGLVAGFDRAVHPAAEAARPPATDTPATSSTAQCGQTVTGDSISTRWGPVQVEAAVAADGSICESRAVVYPDGDGESLQINAYALPIIEDAVLAQGVQFDAVSGATYTSEGYRASLQSILDKWVAP
ncbi:MAG: FMN-binding protein [Candidatus Nanopelagicales bacterium]